MRQNPLWSHATELHPSRDEILAALSEYQGSVILVSHDEGAVQALKPERVILLPDGDEDLWKDDYFDLVSID